MAEGKPRLLVVDDEQDMLDFLERVLRRRFAVTRTSSADEAVRILDEGDYEVLLTDQKMPRVTGLELLERIGGDHPGLVKLLISGFTEMPAIQRAVDSGQIHNYVVKPVDSERLIDAIEQAYRVRDSGGSFTPTQD